MQWRVYRPIGIYHFGIEDLPKIGIAAGLLRSNWDTAKLSTQSDLCYTGHSACRGVGVCVDAPTNCFRRRYLSWDFGVQVMAQTCDICGKGPQFGNNISHAHNVTRRRWNVNLQAVKALVNGAPKRIRVCTSCIKSGKIAKA